MLTQKSPTPPARNKKATAQMRWPYGSVFIKREQPSPLHAGAPNITRPQKSAPQPKAAGRSFKQARWRGSYCSGQRESAASSATTTQLVCSCRMEAGHWGVTAPKTMSCTAWALSSPVAATTIMRAFMMVCTPMV